MMMLFKNAPTTTNGVTIESHTETFKLAHREAIVRTLEDLGTAIAVEIRHTLDVDWPPASKPGESPHRRTALLLTGVGNQTDESDSGVKETIYSGRAGGDPNVPLYLEEKMNRPYMSPAKQEWAGRIGNELSNGIRGNLGV